VVCPHDGSRHAAGELAGLLGVPLYGPEAVVPLLESVAQRPDGPHILVGYAWDAGEGIGEPLRRVLLRGPEHGVHVLGWWRTVARLRDDLGGPGARLDAIGAWVALDVHGSDLAPLYPHPGGPIWYPRPGRGLYFDRSVHRVPEVLVPYRFEAKGAG
jgi:hypothetical protein